MKWQKRSLVDKYGFSVTSVTDSTPVTVFMEYQRLVNLRLTELDECMEAFAKQRASGRGLIKQPAWSKRKEQILNQAAKQAGLVDS